MEQTKKREDSSLDVVGNLMSARQGRVESLLEGGSLFIQKDRKISNKRQLQMLEQIDHARMIKIKDGELRSKLDILHDKMMNLEAIDHWDQLDDDSRIQEELQKKIAESMDAGNYALDSEKTKIAKDYVKYMQQQRKYLHKRQK